MSYCSVHFEDKSISSILRGPYYIKQKEKGESLTLNIYQRNIYICSHIASWQSSYVRTCVESLRLNIYVYVFTHACLYTYLLRFIYAYIDTQACAHAHTDVLLKVRESVCKYCSTRETVSHYAIFISVSTLPPSEIYFYVSCPFRTLAIMAFIVSSASFCKSFLWLPGSFSSVR